MPVETEPVYGKAEISGDEYRLVIGGSSGNSSGNSTETGLVYKTDRYNTAGKLDITVLSGSEIPEEIEVSVSIRGSLIFRGTIRNSKPGSSRRNRLNCYDAVADLKRNFHTATYNEVPIRRIAENAISDAGVEGDISLPPVQVSPSFDDTRCDKILEKVARWGDGAWWVNQEDKVIITENVASETERHKPELIRDVSPGKRTPAYQSVKVIGSSPVSRKGPESRNLVSSEPVVATKGTDDPEFTVEDNDITTQKQAQNVANMVYKRLQSQQKSGSIKLVGDESIRALDTIIMPERYGGEEYLVSSVKHTINSQDGFRTSCKLGGLIQS